MRRKNLNAQELTELFSGFSSLRGLGKALSLAAHNCLARVLDAMRAKFL